MNFEKNLCMKLTKKKKKKSLEVRKENNLRTYIEPKYSLKTSTMNSFVDKSK